MRGFMIVAGIACVVAAAVSTLRRSGLNLDLPRGGHFGLVGLSSAREEQIIGELSALRRELTSRLDEVSSRIGPWGQQFQVGVGLERVISDVESMQQEVVSREDRIISEVESMENEMLRRLDDIRSQVSRVGERDGSQNRGGHGKKSKAEGKS